MTKEDEDTANELAPGEEEGAREGTNAIWWVALFVSLGLWYGLIDATVWAFRQIAN